MKHRPKELVTSIPDFRDPFLFWAKETRDEKTARIKRIYWNWLIYNDTGYFVQSSPTNSFGQSHDSPARLLNIHGAMETTDSKSVMTFFGQ